MLPEAPPPPPRVPVRVVANDVRACAIFDNGMLQCWGGFNFEGELGVGDKKTRTTPAWVAGLRGVRSLTLSEARTCATTEAGQLYCWGQPIPDTGVGRIAITTPQRVAKIEEVTDVALGDDHACALQKSGDVSCWGANAQGQLGRGASAGSTSAAAPEKVEGLPPAAGVLAARDATVAWTRSGKLFVWGSIGASDSQWRFDAPHEVAGIEDVTRVVLSRDHVCALRKDGQVRCFTHETLPAFEAGREYDFGPEYAKVVAALTKGAKPSKRAGKRKKWVGSFVFPDGRGLSGVVDVGVWNHDASAVTDKGEVFSWGNPERGTIGHPPDTKGFLGPTKIAGITDALKIAGGFTHRCALDARGRVSCFGKARRGLLGAADADDAVAAIPIAGLPKVVSIASNDHCNFALGEDTKLYAWGESWVSACGIEDTQHPTPAPVVVPLEPPP